MTPEQIEKKAEDFARSRYPANPGLPSLMEDYGACKRMGSVAGYKQGYTDALSDAKEDAIEYSAFLFGNLYSMMHGDLQGKTMEEIYNIYQASKTK